MPDTPSNRPTPPSSPDAAGAAAANAAAEDADADADADRLAAHLRATVSALVRGTRRGDQIAPIPAAVLDLLDVRGPMTTAELAASRGVRHQTMAVTVKELADAGHLSAGADPEDARKKILSLTASGKSALDADREHRVGLLAQAMNEVLNDDERKVMAQALALIDRVGRAVNRMTAT